MSLSQQADSIEELSRMYSGERNKKVVEKWEKISDDFRKYTDKVRRSPYRLLHCKSPCQILAITHRQMRKLQDRNQDVFSQLKIESKQTEDGVIDIPPVPE